jgi:hypothetical protein
MQFRMNISCFTQFVKIATEVFSITEHNRLALFGD